MKTLKQHLQEKEFQCRTNSLHNYDIIQAVKKWLQEQLPQLQQIENHFCMNMSAEDTIKKLIEELEQ